MDYAGLGAETSGFREKVTGFEVETTGFRAVIGVHEGRKHLVKHICHSVGYEVKRLKRLKIGPFAGFPPKRRMAVSIPRRGRCSLH